MWEIATIFARFIPWIYIVGIFALFGLRTAATPDISRSESDHFEGRLRAAKIFDPPVSTKVLVGETAIFFCRARGNPSPNVHFLLDRTLTEPYQQSSVSIPDGSALRLGKVKEDQNGLQIQCVARNHVGGDSASAQLSVVDPSSIIPDGFPSIHVPPTPVVVSVGDVAQLNCEVVGYPLPKVIWLKNEIPIPLNNARLTITGSGSLQFEHALTSDEGHYECLAINEVGSVLSAKAFIKIKNTHSAPNIINRIDQIRVRPGHGANLTCRATGNPIPHTRWLTDRESPITEPSESTATLFVADITEPTRYICEANNSLGTIQHPVRIHVVDVPPPPNNLRSLEIGPYHAFLQWYPPLLNDKNKKGVQDTLKIDSYTLFLAESMESTNVHVKKKQITDIPARQYHPDGALQHKVTELKPFTHYTAEVAAVSNTLGMSDSSNSITFITAEVAPSSPPLMISAVPVSDEAIDVHWRAPHNPNGRITGYSVLYSPDNTLPTSKWRRLSTNVKSVQIHELLTGETYYVKVAAENSIGVGPFSDATSVTVKYGVPSQPINIRGIGTSPRSIYLNWTAPHVASGVQLQDYLVRYRSYQAEHSEVPLDAIVAATQTDHVLDNLMPNTTYLVSVSARTKYGMGVASQLSVRTESNVPEMPIPEELVVVDASSIRVRWTAHDSSIAPAEDQTLHFRAVIYKPSHAQHFLLQWAPFPFTEWEERKIAAVRKPHHIYEFTLDGLLSKTAYRVRIGAVGSEGMGPIYEWNPVITKGQVPSAPQNLRLNQLRRAQPQGYNDPKAEVAIVELAWDPPERSHGDLNGYQVSYRSVDQKHVHETDRADHRSFNIEFGGAKPFRRNVTQTTYTSTISEGIQFGRTYQFEVAAFNSVDLGLPAQLNISLPDDIPESYPIQVRLNGLSANAIEVTWSPPSPRQIHEEVVKYQVKYFQPHSPNTTEVVRTSNEPRLVIENLKERTFYTVVVRALTKSGPGPWSMASTIQTTAELPEPPSHISGIRINPRQIKVTWDINTNVHKPYQRVVPVTGFRIYYSKNVNEADLSSWRILDVGPVTMATLDDLDPDSEYVIKMKARGADRRYGRLSDPIVVGSRVPDDELPNELLGMSPADKELTTKLTVDKLSCRWTLPLDTAKPEEASLKLNWRRPKQAEGLHKFQIQLLGTKSFVDENNQPRRLVFDPRTLEVSQAMLEPFHPHANHISLPYLASSDDGGKTAQPHYSLVIDELVANTVYDVQIRPVYLPQTVPGHIAQTIILTGRTSCRTMMLPPLHVPAPLPVAIKHQTGQVVMRVFRVSESLGRIRRYYLILSKASAAVEFENLPESDESFWRNKFRESSQLWDPETFIAAEYSQEVFEESSLELLLSNPNYQLRKRRSLGSNSVEHLQSDPVNTNDYLADNPNAYDPDVLVYGRELIKNQDYRAFVLACIYPNSDVPENGVDNSIWTSNAAPDFGLNVISQTESAVTSADKHNQNLCSASQWSVKFSPNALITAVTGPTSVAKETRNGIVTGIHLDSAKQLTVGSRDMFTVSIIAVIVGLGLLAIVCIAVGCVMRRRPRKLKSDRSISLAINDNTLKTPLMGPPKFTSFSEKDAVTDTIPPPISPANSPRPQPKVRAAIAIDCLPEHVAKLKMNGGLELTEEYESIESEFDCTWRCANLAQNRPKNRYANVVAYDHSRVVLTEIDGLSGSDYINANYIDGYQHPNAYVATQGPLPETFYDFWRMVWEQNSRTIVMMTRLEERARVKCDQYWPGRGTETYICSHEGKPIDNAPVYTVTIRETAEFAYYTMRTFNLRRQIPKQSAGDMRMDSENETREVKHFQFTAWPDYGTPDQSQPLLLFIRRVTQVRSHMLHQIQQEKLANGDSYAGRGSSKLTEMQSSKSPNCLDDLGPTIVHCSAGVGRTGAFIVIDSQLERLRNEKSVDIYGAVGRMRAQRNFMVQTEEQYTFLYDVFVEAATVHGTEVTAHGLYNHVVKLRQTTPASLLSSPKTIGNGMVETNTYKGTGGTNQFGLELEFKRLSDNLLVSKQFTAAMLQENRLKNRTMDILPFETNRVCLHLIRGIPGSDYINASFVDGYRRKRAYIATQTPLPNTADDFWRLIWEHNSPIIVVLVDPTNLIAHSDIYWPMERSTRYQHLLVEPMVEYNMPNFVLREFRLTDTRDGQTRTVRQFQLHGWPQDLAVPRLAEGMIELIGQVHKTQTQFGQDGPITVHCNTGSGRSGVFICLSLLLERMRCEGMVDVFLTTRQLRTQRSNMIQTADQYAFCYAATLEYLASFDHYTS